MSFFSPEAVRKIIVVSNNKTLTNALPTIKSLSNGGYQMEKKKFELASVKLSNFSSIFHVLGSIY